ncbi:nuclear envelope phosphatase-regulatory subunit 1 isoform X1 [Microcebus murinus]|uniref:nuclear envelope phosphatase-regulatory subunit 1 isoform X1 n=1 Tax=Microcebus murinus TaxID=30608 RepID=UPI003F6D82C6
MNSLEQAEDLKAFERRLTEYIHCLQPATGRWRMLLIVVSVCTATGAWNWLIDPETQKVSFFTSLWNHPFFTISCITLIGLFFAGIHKRVVAPSIIAARCRTVLAEYNMSCDDMTVNSKSMPMLNKKKNVVWTLFSCTSISGTSACHPTAL